MARKQEKQPAANAAEVAKVVPAAIHPRVFRHTVDQADIAISITDLNGDILYVNPAFTRVTGYGTDEAIGKNESMLSNKTTPPEVYKSLWQHISRGESWSGRLVTGARTAASTSPSSPSRRSPTPVARW